jgi:hypothetical protein
MPTAGDTREIADSVSRTVRCKCHARRTYQPFQCAARRRARKGVTKVPPGHRAKREVRACRDRLVCGSTDLEERLHPTVLPIPSIFRDEEDTIRAHLR